MLYISKFKVGEGAGEPLILNESVCGGGGGGGGTIKNLKKWGEGWLRPFLHQYHSFFFGNLRD